MNGSTTIFFRDLEDDMIMSDNGGLLRVKNVEQFEDAGVTRFNVASLDGSYVSTEWEFEDDELVDIVDECHEDLSEDAFEEYLDGIYDTVEVCGMTMSAARVLREMDPTAFAVMHSDWTDEHERDCGQH